MEYKDELQLPPGIAAVGQTDTSSLNSPIDWARIDTDLGFDRMKKNKKQRKLEYIVLYLLLAWIWAHHGHIIPR